MERRVVELVSIDLMDATFVHYYVPEERLSEMMTPEELSAWEKITDPPESVLTQKLQDADWISKTRYFYKVEVYPAIPEGCVVVKRFVNVHG